MKKTGLFLFFLNALALLAPAGEPIAPFERETAACPSEHIDTFVFGKLRELGIQPAYPCSDAVFVRRVYLDVIGTLPQRRKPCSS